MGQKPQLSRGRSKFLAYSTQFVFLSLFTLSLCFHIWFVESTTRNWLAKAQTGPLVGEGEFDQFHTTTSSTMNKSYQSAARDIISLFCPSCIILPSLLTDRRIEFVCASTVARSETGRPLWKKQSKV